MNIYPNNLPEQLDFNIIIENLSEFCYGKNAQEKATNLKPINKFHAISKLLIETNEFLLSINRGDSIGSIHYPEIDKELNLLNINNAVLSALQFHQIRNLIILSNELIHFFEDKTDVYPNLKLRLSHLSIDKMILKFINDIIDKDAIVRDDASTLLQSIRKDLIENRKTTDRAYRIHIQRLKKLGHLADFEESFVNGRRVLGVLAEHKREFKGIILGQSASGKITFMEPQNLIELNNERIELEDEEKKEIHRIMKELSEVLRPFSNNIKLYYDALCDFDFISAKAKLAKLLNATHPILCKNEHKIHLQNAFHPVLFLQNTAKKEATIPINCTMNHEQRIMVISGPNAGGKSITLKTIGLLQLMLQSGLLIPVSAKSELSIKDNMFGDIGDNQSIEDGLSTYSSRLIKMKFFLQNVDAGTLFLIDEFGTGSDPDMGGAMAEVILDKLNATKVQGIITTHFTNLKILANHNEGIFNACMLFNSKTLKPLYQLHVGEPGSSFTFEVAEKIGLSIDLINEAKSKLSKAKVNMDKLLNQLQVEKNVIAKLKIDLHKQMSKTTAEKREFQDLNTKLEDHIEKSGQNKEEKQKLIEFGKKLHILTQEWESNKNKKEVIAKFVKLASYEKIKKKTQEDFEKTEAFKEKKLAAIKSKIEIGSKVRLLKSREIGIIQSMKDNRVKVLFGKVEMNVAMEKLEIAF